MKRFLFGTAIVVFMGLLLAPIFLNTFEEPSKETAKLSNLTKNDKIEEPKFQEISNSLEPEEFTKVAPVKSKLTLETSNMVVLRGPVTEESVSSTIRQLQKLSKSLPKTAKIYLVLDTPGGSIFDGLDLIDYIEAIPQEVKTVTLFAASMGFQIVENTSGERLISRNGILMSHRAAGGVQGQFNGELESRYRMVRRKIDYLDQTVAKKVGLTYDEYQKKIKDEWWIHGFDAVDQKVADTMVLVSCGASLEGKTEEMQVRTMFGTLQITFDACPLIKAPIAVNLSGIQNNAKPYMSNLVTDMTVNKAKFVDEVITTNKFYEIFK